MTQDLYYYESGYFTPENYHGYLADAEISLQPYAIDYDDGSYVENPGALSILFCDANILTGVTVEANGSFNSNASETINVSVIRSFNVNLNSSFEQTVMISHIEGADLFAFTDATLAIQVSRIRDNNIAATSAFSVSTSAQRVRYVSSEEDSAFTMDVANLRVRFNEAAIDAAFSLAASVGKIVQGSVGAVSRTAKSISAFGNAAVSTVQKKFGAGSIAFDGTGDYLKINSNSDFNFGTGDFTVEGWAYRATTGVAVSLFDFRTAATQTAPWLYIGTGGSLLYVVNSSNRISTGSGTIGAGSWYHVAVSRSGTDTRVFVNGTQAGSTYTDTNNYIESPLTIGSRYTGANEFFNGYIDELRVTKGLARYTSTFTAPTAAFVNDTNTVLLIHGDTDISDDPGAGGGLQSTFTSSITNLRVRFADSALTSTSSLTANATLIPGGVAVEASGDWASNFSLTAAISHIEGADLSAFSLASVSATVDKFTGISAGIETTTSVEVQILKIQAGAVSLESNSSLTALAQLTAGLSSDITATTTVSVQVLRIQDSSVDLSGAFTPVMTVSVLKNSFAVLDSTATISANATITSSLSSTINSSSSLTIDLSKVLDASASLTSQTTVSASGLLTQGLAASITSTAALDVTNYRIVQFNCAVNSAFTPTLTVNVFKNSFAVLDSTASLLAQAVTTVSMSAGLASTSTATISAARIKSTSAILSATTSQYFKGSFKNKRPRSLYEIGNNGNLVTSTSKFGTGSLFTTGNATASNGFFIQSEGIPTISSGQDFYINAWIYVPNPILVGTSTSVYTPLITADGWSLGYFSVSNGMWARFSYPGGSVLTADVSNGGDARPSGWSRWTIYRSGSTLTFKFKNASFSELTMTRTFTGTMSTGTTIALGDGTGTGTGTVPAYFDELFMAIGTSTTLSGDPDGQISDGNLDTTQFLFHMEGNLDDDFTGSIKPAEAALVASSSLSLAISKVTLAAGQLSSNSSLTASIAKTFANSAALSADGFLVAAFGRIRPFADIEVATFSLTSDINVVATASTNLAATSSISVDVTKQFGPVLVDLDAATSLSADAQVTSGVTAVLEVNGFVVAAYGRIRPEFADLTASTELTVETEVVKVVSANLSSTSSISCSVTKVFGQVTADLTSIANLAGTVNIFQGVSASLTAATSQTCDNIRIRYIPAAIASEATLTSEPSTIRGNNVEISSSTNLSSQILRVKQLSSNFSAITVELAAVNKIGNILVDCAVNSVLIAEAIVQSAGSVPAEVNCTLVCFGDVTKPFASTATTLTTLTVQAESGLIGGANLQSNFELTADADESSTLTANLVATSSMAVSLSTIQNVISMEMAFADMAVSGLRVRPGSSNQTAQFNLVINAGKQVRATAQLQCQGFILSTGRKLNLIDIPSYTIPNENRTWYITPESNSYTIEFENRSYKIKG